MFPWCWLGSGPVSAQGFAGGSSSSRSLSTHPHGSTNHPVLAPTGGSSCLASRGGCLRLLLRPRQLAGEDASAWSSYLTEVKPSVGFLATGRVATCLASGVVVVAGRLVRHPSQRRSSSSKLLSGALTPPSNPHTTRPPHVTTSSMTHICRKSPNWPQPH